MTPQRITEAVTIPIPIATDNRKDSLSTDHGSTRATVSRTLRGAPDAAGAAAPGLAAEKPAPPVDPGGGDPTGLPAAAPAEAGAAAGVDEADDA